jgi:glycosyltransferase involved in cell wall biosynthesis
MYNIYISPKIINAKNPYIRDLEESLSAHFKIVNEDIKGNTVYSLFKYIFKADIFFLNWIEDLAVRRYGRIQVIAFILFLFCAKCLGKKIVWTLHNKYSHHKTKSFWIDLMYGIMIKRSDFIITHSQSGVDIIKEKYPLHSKKVKYLVHPIKPIAQMLPGRDYIFDFFIWGEINPYKGITEFLRFLRERRDGDSFKVLIAGQCQDRKYKKELESLLTSNIIYYDEFFGMDEIARFADKSKYTLFTYRPESVLSSGSLIESIRMGSAVIGPDAGAFKDLSSYDFVRTYTTFEEIIDIYLNFNYNKENLRNEIRSFCRENSWELFGEKIHSAVEGLV